MNRQSGFGLLELLIGLSVSSLLVLAAMGFVRWHLTSLLRGTLAGEEAVVLSRFEESISRVWDHRSDHVLQSEAWLVIAGEASLEGTRLRRLWILSVTSEGKLAGFEWEKEEAGWMARQHWIGALEPAAVEWGIGYAGEILINQPPGNFMGGSAPGRIRFQFPDAVFSKNRQGFAIEDNW